MNHRVDGALKNELPERIICITADRQGMNGSAATHMPEIRSFERIFYDCSEQRIQFAYSYGFCTLRKKVLIISFRKAGSPKEKLGTLFHF